MYMMHAICQQQVLQNQVKVKSGICHGHECIGIYDCYDQIKGGSFMVTLSLQPRLSLITVSLCTCENVICHTQSRKQHRIGSSHMLGSMSCIYRDHHVYANQPNHIFMFIECDHLDLIHLCIYKEKGGPC